MTDHSLFSNRLGLGGGWAVAQRARVEDFPLADRTRLDLVHRNLYQRVKSQNLEFGPFANRLGRFEIVVSGVWLLAARHSLTTVMVLDRGDSGG